MRKFDAAIFDMDGLMVDSEIYWPIAEREIWPNFGIEFTPEWRNELLGLDRKDAVKRAKEVYGIDVSIERLRDLYNDKANFVYQKSAELMPGVLELIEKCKNAHIKMAIASSSPLEWIEIMMGRFNVKSYFEFVHSTVALGIPGKPDPAVYNFTSKKLKVDPNCMVVLEDSSPGVIAGKGSGAQVVAVVDKRWGKGDYSQADLIVSSLEDKKIYSFLGI